MNQPLQSHPRFGELASGEAIERTARALEANGFTAHVVDTGQDARDKVLELIPKGAEVMTMTSVTLDAIGVEKALNKSGAYDAIQPKLLKMDYKTQAAEMRKLAAAPDYVVGSVQAVTEDGHLLVASNSGSQLATYVYTAGKVLWVVGAQKIVRDEQEGLRRIQEYSFPREDERAQKAYGMRSGVNKLLIIRKEIAPQRATVILVKENLGF